MKNVKNLRRSVVFLCLIGIALFLYSKDLFSNSAPKSTLEDYIERNELVLSSVQRLCQSTNNIASITGKTQWSSNEEIEFELINHSNKELFWWPHYDSQESGLSIYLNEKWLVVPFRDDCDIGLSLYEFPGSDTISSLFKFGYPELCPGLYRFMVRITDADNTLQEELLLSIRFEITEKD